MYIRTHVHMYTYTRVYIYYVRIFSRQQIVLVLCCQTITGKANLEEPVCTGWFRNGSPVLRSSTKRLLWTLDFSHYFGFVGSRRLYFGAFKVRNLLLVWSCLGVSLQRYSECVFFLLINSPRTASCLMVLPKLDPNEVATNPTNSQKCK